jgi:hypothetical protein
MRKRWVPIDGWRGHYEPVPPQGWELLCECSVVNEAGEQCRDIITKWLHENKIRYRSGYLRTSNVFSANLYVIVEEGKVDDLLKQRIDQWFVDETTSTFSIFSGKSWALDVARVQQAFDNIVDAPGVYLQFEGGVRR